MPMSTRQIVYLLTAIAAVTIASVLILQSGSDKYRVEAPSTYSTHPKGCKALYLLMERLQLPVDRFRKPFERISGQEGALIVINPQTTPFERGEISKLEEWVKKGNRLVIFQGPSSRSSVAPRKDRTDTQDAGKWTRAGRSSLAYRFGLRLKKRSSDGRTVCKVSTPRLEQIEELSVSEATRWATPAKEWDTLVADQGGPLVVLKRLGKGEIVAIADPTLVENRFLAEAHNARFLVALLLHEPRPRRILFDEYHHGHAFTDSFWTYTAASVFAWILFQSALGLALVIYSRRAGQAGRFQSLIAPKGRSSVEYVESMSNVFSSRKAGIPALEMILRRFLAQISRRTGIPLKNARSNTGDERLMKALGESEAAELVKECRRSIDTGAEPSAALKLAKGLQNVYRRILGTRRSAG